MSEENETFRIEATRPTDIDLNAVSFASASNTAAVCSRVSVIIRLSILVSFSG